MNNRKILLVEDNPYDEELALRAISKWISTPVVVAHDGVEALEYLFATGSYTGRDVNDLPAVILLDLKLPRMDGLETLRCLRKDERTQVLSVIVFTSSDEEQDIINCYRCGANSFIRKPVDYDEFNRTIGQLGLYWLFLNESPIGRKEL